ncbi:MULTISPECIES: hypothetical protein [unclassified Variovorax]|uniref:hypothetical protein n=1 Tax=unclassified Variovorax TaxID=663243 RepID=UPI00131692BB|nr:MULTISPECIES: hypothetical protein [unclassified Variovorax]VTU33055.1 hypothetical protein SRS16CHR_05208 [Variovorax sp. SRS16]VTU39666.1 hypothetical protein E5CHR_05164 [Variovorax sp. PBL-E5]
MSSSLNRIARTLPSALEFEWPARAWRRLSDAWVALHRRALARRDLRSIDERTLRDIGLSHRAAAEWPRIRDEW